MVYKSNSVEDTKNIGKMISEIAAPGAIYCLSGGLGAGKTVFAKGFADGLGVSREVTSPTFTIVNVYYGRLPFYHFDVYRIGAPSEMEDTGYEDYFFGDGICLIEWAENIKELIPETAVWIDISQDFNNENLRIINIH